jgi:hypothetical protein
MHLPQVTTGKRDRLGTVETNAFGSLPDSNAIDGEDLSAGIERTA